MTYIQGTAAVGVTMSPDGRLFMTHGLTNDNLGKGLEHVVESGICGLVKGDECPGGLLSDGESILTGMIREYREEAGSELSPDQLRLLDIRYQVRQERLSELWEIVAHVMLIRLTEPQLGIAVESGYHPVLLPYEGLVRPRDRHLLEVISARSVRLL